MQHAKFCPDTRLARAIECGDLQRVRRLIPAHQPVSLPCPDGMTPLARACGEANPAIVSVLLELGADPNQPAFPHQWTITPLIIALDACANDCVRVLLDAGADPNVVCEDFQYTTQGEARCTPLLLAQVTCNGPAVELLLANGADPQGAQRAGISERSFRPPRRVRGKYLVSGEPVCELIRAGASIAAIETALRHVAELDENGGRLLRTACNARRPEVIDLLLAHGANPNAISIPLAVVDDGTGLIAELLLRAGYDATHHPSGCPLVTAARMGNVQVVQQLIAHGAEPDVVTPSDLSDCEPTPLIAALLAGHVACAEALLARGAHPNLASSGLPSRDLLRAGEPSPLQAWYEARIFERSPAGPLTCPPLAVACGMGLVNAVEALLRHGASPQQRDSAGNLPIEWLDLAAPSIRSQIAASLNAPRSDAAAPPPLF